MNDARTEQRFDLQKGLPGPDAPADGDAVSGNDRLRPDSVEGDSPTEGTVEGPPGPTSSAGSPELDAGAELAPSEQRPTQSDPRVSDGLAVFKDMEEDGDLRYLRASPYNLH